MALVAPVLHVGLMGESGAGKSMCAATFPKPMLVLHADTYGKDEAYLERGVRAGETTGISGHPVVWIASKTDPKKLLVQLEYYHDDEPTVPTAFAALLARVQSLRDEVREGKWKTVVLETFTSLDLYARYYRSYGPFKTDKPNIQATEDVEQMLSRLNGLRCNVVVNCHVDKDPVMVDGQSLKTPMAPGRLQKGFAANFTSELYRAYSTIDAAGARHYLLQTQPDGRFICVTRINAPDPCVPDYRMILSNWLLKHGAIPAPATETPNEKESA